MSLGIPKDLIKETQRFLFDPGICIAEEACTARRTGRVNSMHDITEGGLANGLMELAMEAGVEIVVDESHIPVYTESKILCDTFGINPLGVMSSGALLVTAPSSEADKILSAAQAKGITMSEIGHVGAAGKPSVTLLTSHGPEPFLYFKIDEVTKIL